MEALNIALCVTLNIVVLGLIALWISNRNK